METNQPDAAAAAPGTSWGLFIRATDMPEYIWGRDAAGNLRGSRSAFERLRQEPGFPKPVKTGGQLQFLRADVDRWAAARPKEHKPRRGPQRRDDTEE